MPPPKNLAHEKNMNRIYSDIAQELYKCLPHGEWIKAEYIFRQIGGYASATGRYEDKTGKVKGISGVADGVLSDFEKLRLGIPSQHLSCHAWYTAIITMTPDGKFKFDFDYDSLPAFDVAPDPDDFKVEFQQFPRPELQAQVQDWMDSKPSPKDFEKMAARLKKLNKTKTIFSYD